MFPGDVLAAFVIALYGYAMAVDKAVDHLDALAQKAHAAFLSWLVR